MKYHGNAFSISGTPDILACVNGKFVAIEVKSQNGKPSELQLAKIRVVKKSGGLGFVVYPNSWDNLKNHLDGLMRKKGDKKIRDMYFLFVPKTQIRMKKKNKRKMAIKNSN